MKKYAILIFVLLIHFSFSQRANYSAGKIANVKWSDDGKSVTFVNKGKDFKFNILSKKLEELGESTYKAPDRWARYRNRGTTVKMGSREVARPKRGYQFMTEISHDEEWFAVCKDYNVWLENDKTGEKIQVTTEGHFKMRYGTADWVYGEELGVRNGMWFSKDDRYLAYYVFDESPVKDFYILSGITDINTEIMKEGYVKAGAENPIASLEIYDRKTKKRMPIDVGQKERDQYIYNMRLTPAGDELLFNRTDRYHQHMEVLALNFATGKTRIVVEEKQDTWQDNAPGMRFLADNERYIWPTEKTMWKHYELRHINGKKLATLTSGEYQDIRIIKIDEDKGYMYYTSYSDPNNHINLQLHRVKLDGTDQKRLTPESKNYSGFSISPDGNYFTAVYETVSETASSAVFDMSGKKIEVLAEGPKVETRSELFTYKAEDGTTLYGIINYPENFNPKKKYPLIVNVYGGPESRAIYNNFRNGHSYNKQGYIVAQFDNRGTHSRGKKFMGAVYKKLGDIDIMDQAQGVKHLRKRAYVDGSRVGIVGHSYGGYMAAMAIVKYPDVFQVAVDRAGVTDWRNYDSIYTERFMSTPQMNKEGYDNGSAMPFVKNITGKLLIMHGMVDDNVHPNNAWQFIEALDKAKISYESRYFPHGTHGFDGRDTQMAFFKKHLKPEIMVKKND